MNCRDSGKSSAHAAIDTVVEPCMSHVSYILCRAQGVSARDHISRGQAGQRELRPTPNDAERLRCPVSSLHLVWFDVA